MRTFLLSVFSLLAAVEAHACSIPVFRYALDRWQADPFALEISAADVKDEAVARFLRNQTDASPLNMMTSRTNEEGPSRLTFPHAEPTAAPAWAGKLDGKTLPRITDSPVRAEIVKRILAGDCGVWVLVESGQREADDRAAAALEKRLRYLEQVAQIPPIDPNDPTSQLGPGPALGVKFFLLRIKADDESEKTFTAMLAGPNGYMENANGPWLSLVFGRGRALGAWAAEGFGNEQIDEACLFLLGACSCEVKRMNPGWDLLVNVDWNESLHAMGIPPTPSVALQKPVVAATEPDTAKPEPEKPEAAKPETVTIAAAQPAPTAPRNRFGRTAIAAAVLSGHSAGLSNAKFNPDGLRVVTASDDKTAKVWDAASGKVIAILSGHEGEVRGAQFSPDGSRIVTGSLDNTARLWDARTGKSLAILAVHDEKFGQDP